MNPRSFLASLALPLAALAIGCGTEDPPEDDVASTQQALSNSLDEMPQNGYPPDGLDPNHALLSTVWQHPLTDAGVFSTLNTPLSTDSPVLVSSLFQFPENPLSAEYLMKEIVECALDLDQHVSATFNTKLGATTRIWNGKFGLCGKSSPFGDWSISGSIPACRQMVSACVLARMNALHKHVPISIRIPEQIAGGSQYFRPVDKVRVATYRRTDDGTKAADGWQPDFVGICTRGRTVTLQRTLPAMGQSVRVCTGIHACDPGKQESLILSPSSVYSGLLDTSDNGSIISFTCPTNAATAPSGKNDQAYFSILVKPGIGGIGGTPSLDPMLQRISISSPTTIYPALERDVFTFPEGAYYGHILTDPGASFDRKACYSDLWTEGQMYELGRMCAAPGDPYGCFISSGPCDHDSWGRDTTGGQAFYGFKREPGGHQWYGVTVFLNDPNAIFGDKLASAIKSVHDMCTPGAPMANNGTNGVVTSVCAADSYCCSAAWDSRCVGEVQTVANSQACHPVCTTGAALTNGSNPVVTSICAVDPFCCNTAWDGTCVQEVQTVANSQACGCSHAICTTGAALNNSCSPVVTSICTADPFCCNSAWDSICIQEVQTVANSQVCACSHPVCTAGAALTTGCSPVVTSVCTSDPYCCSTAWDSICIQEVQTVANSEECIPP